MPPSVILVLLHSNGTMTNTSGLSQTQKRYGVVSDMCCKSLRRVGRNEGQI